MRVRRAVIPALTVTLVASLLLPADAPPAAAISSLGSIPVGDGPTAIALRSDNAVAFVANSQAATVTAVTLATQTTTSISVGFAPADLRVRPGTNELWVTNFASGTISIVNTLTFTETTSFGTAGSPQDIAFSANGSRAYVTFPNTDQVKVFDTTTRAVVTTYDVGDVPQGIAVDAERNRLIVASGGSTATGDRVTFVNLSTGAVTSLALAADATGVHVDAARDRAYVSMFGLGFVARIDLTTDTLIGYLSVGGQPNRMRPTFDNRLLLLAAGNSVVTIDLETTQERTRYTTPTFTNDVVMAPNGRTVYSTSFGSDAVSVARLEIDRFAGSDRYQTAIQMSQEAYPGTHGTVYLASGTSFPDALALAPAIGVRNGPLLLNPQNTLRADVLAEIQRLDPTIVIIAGGTGVISEAVEAQIEATGAGVLRLSGDTRYATSLQVIQEFFEPGDPFADLYLVTGRDFPDALSAGAAAAAAGVPMLLVDGSANSLPAGVITRIGQLDPDRVILVGGTGVMSQGIQNQLVGLGGRDIVRAAGTDRYATSVAVTELGFDFRPSPASYWATGANFPDALAGITLAAPDQAPIYLVRPGCLPSDVLHGAWRHNADRIGILGGTGVVSTAVENLTRC
ncbi:cell wall-binding repeat-containing protein [Microcella sp.]|uniref:cell wall-binding repeat-containing protein n=1 Tax=Microcella sp. TaxID=1913979 RepID=UPI003F71C348